MRVSTVIESFKPSMASLGYGLFLAINATGAWGGAFPFLPQEFQKPEVLLYFFIAQSTVFFLSYLASTIGSYWLPEQTRVFLVKVACTPYLLGWGCVIAALYFSAIALQLVVVAGAMIGVGSCAFYMMWQRLFSSQDSDEGNHNHIVGTIYGALLYFSLYLIPEAVTTFLMPTIFMPLFALAIILQSRRIDYDQAMFEDVPREHPKVYQRLMQDCWRSALCVGALALSAGLMRAAAISNPATGSLVNIMSMLALLVTAAGMQLLWNFTSIRFSIIGSYRIFFPLVITAFAVLPFAGNDYTRILAAVLFALYSVVALVMMIQCAQTSRDSGTNPVFIYGFFGSITYALHDIGFVMGTLGQNIEVGGVPTQTAIAVAAIYLLGIMYFVGHGGFKRTLRDVGYGGASGTIDMELVALPPIRAVGAGSATNGATAGVAGGVTAAGVAAAGVAGGDGAAGAGRITATTPTIDTTNTYAAVRTNADSEPLTASSSTFDSAKPLAAGSSAFDSAELLTSSRNSIFDSTELLTLASSRSTFDNVKPLPLTPSRNAVFNSTETDARNTLTETRLNGLDRSTEQTYRDKLSKQAALVRKSYRLSERETEVMELIARGNTVARIAEMLVVSENTIRTHSKRIYTKLGIHKKQELIDLLVSFDPRMVDERRR